MICPSCQRPMLYVTGEFICSSCGRRYSKGGDPRGVAVMANRQNVSHYRIWLDEHRTSLYRDYVNTSRHNTSMDDDGFEEPLESFEEFCQRAYRQSA